MTIPVTRAGGAPVETVLSRAMAGTAISAAVIAMAGMAAATVVLVTSLLRRQIFDLDNFSYLRSLCSIAQTNNDPCTRLSTAVARGF